MGKGKLFRLSRMWMKKGIKIRTDRVKKQGALKILPGELWTLILEKVDDFSDRMACFNTCQSWKDILGADLFTREFDQILPQIMDYLDFPSVLACREVCSSWCTAVDNIVANNPKLLPFTTNHQKTSNAAVACYIPEELQTCPTWTLTSVAHVKYLLDEMKTYVALGIDRCPNPARSLRMACLNDSVEQVLDEDMIHEHQDLSCQLTKLMGHHVSYFFLEFDHLQITPLELCQLLRRHLLNLPNLRLLLLDARFLLTDPWTLDDYGAHFDYLEGNPLPYIETLESLSFHGIGFPIQIQHQLLSSHGPQLKKLEMQLSRLSPTLLELLTNLTELEVSIDTRADLRTLTLCRAPIQKLSIIMGLGTVFLAEYLLEVIHRFSTLYQFHLKLSPKVQLWDDDCKFVEDKWKNSSIKHVTIFIDAETDQKVFPSLSFNFLKCFPRLEHLSMEYHEIPLNVTAFADLANNTMFINLNQRPLNDQNRNKEIIELEKYLNRGWMYHSNIWKLLPKLQTFSYQWRPHRTEPVEHLYNRSTYNQLNSPAALPARPVVRKVEGVLNLKKKKKTKLGRRVKKTVGNVCIRAISFLI